MGAAKIPGDKGISFPAPFYLLRKAAAISGPSLGWGTQQVGQGLSADLGWRQYSNLSPSA